MLTVKCYDTNLQSFKQGNYNKNHGFSIIRLSKCQTFTPNNKR